MLLPADVKLRTLPRVQFASKSSSTPPKEPNSRVLHGIFHFHYYPTTDRTRIEPLINFSFAVTDFTTNFFAPIFSASQSSPFRTRTHSDAGGPDQAHFHFRHS